MDKFYYVNAENGYVIVGSKLVNVKLVCVVTRQIEDSISVTLRCNNGIQEFEVVPNDFYLTRDAFERSNPVSPQLAHVCGFNSGIVFDENEAYSFVIGDDGIPYKKNFSLDYIESYLERGSLKMRIPEIDCNIYRKKEWAIENTTYTEVCPDGTEKTHVGLSKLLELDSDQKKMLSEINTYLQLLYDSGVKLVRTSDQTWYAINTKRVQSARVVSEWDDSEWDEREGEETVLYDKSFIVDMNFESEHSCDNFYIRVKR